ncbi:MAG: DNA mismatch repair protein MutS [Phycisphaeraceae bacterium]|nr:DNA mismatch repair protein MutS [Phycisphaeraceae bacterium]
MAKSKRAGSESGDGGLADLTPAMRQYKQFKDLHPECVLFFRMGDFYEMFFDDAKLAHRVLGVTLTQRTEGVPMAGVPYHAVEGYLRRMIQAGHRVAVCEQVEDAAKAKGVVKRDVTRVITPGTLTDESLLEEGQANLLAAVSFLDDEQLSLAWVDLSTGELLVSLMSVEEAGTELMRIAPREVLYAQTGNIDPPPRVEKLLKMVKAVGTPRPGWVFRANEALETLKLQYGVAMMAGFGFADDEPCLAPAGVLVHYLLETQRSPEGGQLGRLNHLQPPRRYRARDHLVIDSTSLLSLEIERTARGGQLEGSLLGVYLQPSVRPRTAMGKRLLRQWLCFPLIDLEAITVRQRGVEVLLQDSVTRQKLRTLLESIQDIERIAGRLGVGRATPRDLVALGRGSAQARSMFDLLEGTEALEPWTGELKDAISPLEALARKLESMCVSSPPNHLREGGLIRDDVDEQLSRARRLQTDSHRMLADYQKELVEQTGIATLKVGFNRVFGYYLEVTAAHAAKADPDWSRVQTLKNAERYTTPELKKFQADVLNAQQRAIEREQELFTELCAAACELIPQLQRFSRMAAALDVLACFAQLAAEARYVRPLMVQEPVLHIQGGRHPVLDQLLGDRFVANDLALGDVRPWAESDEESSTDAAGASPSAASLALITGPNMAGKSTYIRQAALLALLAHTGSFIPASKAVVGMVDRIFTRIGASDELHAGQSTFMVEMIETANLCHHAGERSLVILDEIGRGTSTLDGLSLAWAIADYLAQRGCRTLFATHYHEITQLNESHANVANLHVAVREWEGKIVFLHQIRPGATNRSYGIHVARLAGLPVGIVDRADALLEELEESHHAQHVGAKSKTPAGGGRAGSRQLSLFTEFMEHPVVERLRKTNLDALSPVAAFDLLRELIRSVEDR